MVKMSSEKRYLFLHSLYIPISAEQPRVILKKYKTLSVLIYSYSITTRVKIIVKTRNCVETRVFSHNCFHTILSFLIFTSVDTVYNGNVLYIFYNIGKNLKGNLKITFISRTAAGNFLCLH